MSAAQRGHDEPADHGNPRSQSTHRVVGVADPQRAQSCGLMRAKSDLNKFAVVAGEILMLHLQSIVVFYK